MKRDLDLVRDLLLATEQSEPGDTVYHPNSGIKEPMDVAAAHAELLIEADYVVGHVSKSNEGRYLKWRIDRLTMEGHDHLDSVQSPEVYRETQNRLAKVGGSELRGRKGRGHGGHQVSAGP